MNRYQKLFHLSKRKIQRLGLYLDRLTSPKEDKTSNERELAIIFRKLLRMEDTELLVNPLSNKYYLKNSKNSIFLVFGNGRASVINHVYGYTIPLSPKIEKSLTSMFLHKVDLRRESMEQEFIANVKHSLTSIISKLK